MKTWRCDRCHMLVIDDVTEATDVPIELDGVTIIPGIRTVTTPCSSCSLSPAESNVLYEIMKREGRLAPSWILHEAARMSPFVTTGNKNEQNDLHVQICRIRKKISPYGNHIKPVWGEGYRWD